MNRRVLFRVLLSLVLLVSQQMAIAHAISHWSVAASASGEQAGAEENALSRAVAADKSCAQCLAFAQVDTALASFGPVFVPGPPLRCAVAAQLPAPPVPATVLHYRPRGPPVPA